MVNIEIKIKPNFKIWFEILDSDTDKSGFGEKKMELLRAIDNLGSIKIAAENIGIDYKKAWEMINNMNQYCKKDIITSRRGRSGGASLTNSGYYLLSKYDEYNKKISMIINNIEKAHIITVKKIDENKIIQSNKNIKNGKYMLIPLN